MEGQDREHNKAMTFPATWFYQPKEPLWKTSMTRRRAGISTFFLSCWLPMTRDVFFCFTWERAFGHAVLWDVLCLNAYINLKGAWRRAIECWFCDKGQNHYQSLFTSGSCCAMNAAWPTSACHLRSKFGHAYLPFQGLMHGPYIHHLCVTPCRCTTSSSGSTQGSKKRKVFIRLCSRDPVGLDSTWAYLILCGAGGKGVSKISNPCKKAKPNLHTEADTI